MSADEPVTLAFKCLFSPTTSEQPLCRHLEVNMTLNRNELLLSHREHKYACLVTTHHRSSEIAVSERGTPKRQVLWWNMLQGGHKLLSGLILAAPGTAPGFPPCCDLHMETELELWVSIRRENAETDSGIVIYPKQSERKELTHCFFCVCVLFLRLCEPALAGWGDSHKERSKTGAAVIKISLSYPETKH